MSEPQSPPNKLPAGVEFTFPKAMRGPKDPTTILVAELTLEQEEDADRASSSNKSLGTELVKRAVVAVDGRPIDWAGEGPEWFDRASPKIREFATIAFRKVNRTTATEDEAFLASAVVKSGG